MTTTTQEKKIVKGKHKLNDKEKIENSEELAAAMQERERLKEKQKEVSVEYSDKIKEQDAIVNTCLEKIKTGEEDRDYKCNVVRDEEKKIKKFVDEDSGIVIKEVPFVASDYQMEIAQPETEETK